MNDAHFDRFLRIHLEPEIGAILEWTRDRHPRVSSLPLHRVRVETTSGDQRDLVCKSTAWRAAPARIRDGRIAAGRDHRREPWCYQQLLEPEVLGTARCFGYSRAHHWLLLDDVGGAPLTEIGDHAAWIEAAAWLARFHRFGLERSSSQTPLAPLGSFDDHWSQQLWSNVVRHADTHRLAGLARLDALFQRALIVWRAAPTVVLHGEFFASNVHAIGHADTWSIAPLDWEMTSWGPPAWDVAHLIAGWPPDDQERLVNAYNSEAPAPLSNDELDAATVLLALSQLARGPQLDPLERRFDWGRELTSAVPILRGAS